MFGYVKPQKSELLVREFEEYGGIYCTLCRELGRRYGFPARLALNYDCTFYALVLLSFSSKSCPVFQKGRCVVNPLKKCVYCRNGEAEFAMASALTIILLYHKLTDNITDSKYPKKLFFAFARLLVLGARRRAAGDFPEMDGIVSAAMKRQREIEQSASPGLDLCAEPTARMLGQLLAASGGTGGQNSPAARVLEQFGYFLGRWVYLIDAADDLPRDLRSGSFNPFAVALKLDKTCSQRQLADAREYANQVLNASLAQLGAAADLLELNHLGPIVKNVIFLGLPQIQKELLFKKENLNV